MTIFNSLFLNFGFVLKMLRKMIRTILKKRIYFRTKSHNAYPL